MAKASSASGGGGLGGGARRPTGQATRTSGGNGRGFIPQGARSGGSGPVVRGTTRRVVGTNGSNGSTSSGGNAAKG